MYTALGSNVTFIEALDKLMPGFDGEIAKMAQRTLITPRNIDYHTGVLASKVTPGIPGVKPVLVELVDFKTREPVQTLELDAVLVATGRCALQHSCRACAMALTHRALAAARHTLRV